LYLPGLRPYALPPTLTPTNAVATGSQTVTIAPPSGGLAYYSINGGANTLYTGPIQITSAQMVSGMATVSAYTVQPGYQNSQTPNPTSIVQIDANAASIVQNNPAVWLRADNGPTVSSGNVSAWAD